MTAPARVLVKLAAVLGFALATAVTTTAGSMVTAVPAMAQSASIVVQGNRRVDADTIRSYFNLKPGESLTSAKIDDGLKALYATGLFSDVRVSNQGGRTVVTVVENEVINKIAFEGNKKIKDEQLLGEIQSKERGPLSKAVVQADTQRIVDLYRRTGRSDVKVKPVTIDRGNGRVDLVFEVTEGEKTGVKDIKFVGNKAFSDWKLKDVISTTTTNWLSFLKSTDVYDPDRVNSDQELLRRWYLKNGYADFRIVSASAELDPGGGGFIITIVLDEGAQYRFGKVDVVSNIRDVPAASLRNALRMSDGQVYNAELVEKSVENLTIEVAKSGYAFAQVRPRGDRDFENKRINVTFVVEEGPRVYVERIEIRGNTRTRDWVIRREFDIGEGDAYNRVLVDRAERRLKNLGYFKSIKITNEPGSAPDRVILLVTWKISRPVSSRSPVATPPRTASSAKCRWVRRTSSGAVSMCGCPARSASTPRVLSSPSPSRISSGIGWRRASTSTGKRPAPTATPRMIVRPWAAVFASACRSRTKSPWPCATTSTSVS